ncbi:MAG: Nif3-like dinuclear metal center hexameric protein [Porcipelethomonas sp.]
MGLNMIILDKRLSVCAEMVGGKGIVCDVGTDHAYLASYLVESGKCSRVIASDINDGPLKFAEQTLNKYGIEGVTLVKSDGLENISGEDVSDIVIAGMGGETICDILGKADWIKNVNLVLQPMTRAGHLRKWLYANGFEIVREEAVSHERFVYSVIRAAYTGVRVSIGQVMENIGRISIETDDGMKYISRQYEKLNNIAAGLRRAGKSEDAEKYQRTADSLMLIMEDKMITISEIYNFIDSIAPFSSQEKWDNSGILTGSAEKKVSRVLVTLDITNEVADEAAETGSELVIAHHPVIFNAIKSLTEDIPALRLAKSGISSVCVHTPYDCAKGGMSDIIAELLGFKKTEGILEITGSLSDGSPYGFGCFCEADKEYTSDELALKLKDVLGCEMIRYTKYFGPISNIAVCTGSGGDLIGEAYKAGAQAYITSEVKHDQWLEARRLGIAVFDCGHFHTENPGMIRLCRMLSAEFPQVEFIMSQVNKDPVNYV